jgi:hypothetical protein
MAVRQNTPQDWNSLRKSMLIIDRRFRPFRRPHPHLHGAGGVFIISDSICLRLTLGYRILSGLRAIERLPRTRNRCFHPLPPSRYKAARRSLRLRPPIRPETPFSIVASSARVPFTFSPSNSAQPLYITAFVLLCIIACTKHTCNKTSRPRSVFHLSSSFWVMVGLKLLDGLASFQTPSFVSSCRLVMHRLASILLLFGLLDTLEQTGWHYWG